MDISLILEMAIYVLISPLLIAIVVCDYYLYVSFLGKGFGQVKIQLPHGIVIEFFVTHLQAKKCKKAKNARISQTRQLMEQVDGSKSDAVIIGG